jgi:hypothetical protein
MISEVDFLAQKIWDYHRLNHRIEKSEATNLGILSPTAARGKLAYITIHGETPSKQP